MTIREAHLGSASGAGGLGSASGAGGLGSASGAGGLGSASGAGGLGPWQDVCHVEDLTPERGVAALIEGHPVALFRLDDDDVVAIDDIDPFWGVPVLSRGLVGFLGGRDTVASPLLKQRFDLRTGVCIDDTTVAVSTWPVRILDGRVEVGRAPLTAGT